MTLPVRIRREAELDLTEAFQWYEERREGLGADFLLCVQAALEVISRQPAIHPIVHRQVRRALIRRFPYGVFYLADNDRVTVIAVMHAMRNPTRWKDRA